MIYEKFRNSCLDLTALGLDCGLAVSPYRCTPTNARILAWLVDSKIHFCQAPEFGNTVLAVNPAADVSEQLQPVAKDIPDFIGLLIRCKDASLIAGAHQWSSFRFRALTELVIPGIKAKSVLRALENTYHPPFIEDPAAMMAQLRKEFDNPHSTEWRVGFDTDFSKLCSKAKAGKELALNRSLSDRNGNWLVPAAYLCEDGIVVDTVMTVSGERLLDFRDRWAHHPERSLSLADKLQRQLDNPLSSAVTGILLVNDKPFRCKKSFTAQWNPLEDNTVQVRHILNHYKLDPNQGYLFRRYCFLRKGKYPQIRSLELNLEAVPVPVPDQVFTVEESGKCFRFTHPSTGLEHTFTAVSLNNEALNPNFLTNHPCFYTRLTYALEPSISPENFRVVDQEPGDDWEGYQDDPTAVIYGNRRPDPGRYALSSLHYEPKEQIRWQMIFRRKLQKDLHLKLFP